MAADGSTFTPDRQAILAASIRAALIETGRTLPADDLIAAAASALAPSGDLELTIRMHGWGIKQDPSPAYPVLVAYQSALAEIADPKVRVARLRLEEKSLRTQAEWSAKSAADYRGRVEGPTRWAAAETEGDYWRSMAEAAERSSAAFLEQAAAKSDEADDLAARTAQLMLVVA